MKNLNNKHFFFLTLGIIIICEIISWLGFFNSLIVNIFTSLIILATIFITLKKPVYGFLILTTELLIGSQGYLLWLGQTGHHLSLRIVLWIIVMAIWIIKEISEFIKTKKIPERFFYFSYYFPFLLLLISLIAAVIIGFINHNGISLIFIEAKRWLYIIAIIPLVILFKDEKDRHDLVIVGSAAVIWIAFKTLFLLYIFSHGLFISSIIYSWTRADLLGEITKLQNGFSRVFSTITGLCYSGSAFFFSFIF